VVLIANTGRAVIDIVEQHRIDAALVQYRLPDMRGDVLLAVFSAEQPHLPSHTVVPSAEPRTGTGAAFDVDDMADRLVRLANLSGPS
jgi:CheY-like chemotaxis protein